MRLGRPLGLLALFAVPLTAWAMSPIHGNIKLVGWDPDGDKVAIRIETTAWEGDEETGEGGDVTRLSIDVVACGDKAPEKTFEVMTPEKQTKKDRARGWKKAEKWLKDKEYVFTAGKDAVKLEQALTDASDLGDLKGFGIPKDMLPDNVDAATLYLGESADGEKLEAKVFFHEKGMQDASEMQVADWPDSMFAFSEASCEIHWAPGGECAAILCLDRGPMMSELPKYLTLRGRSVRAAMR